MASHEVVVGVLRLEVYVSVEIVRQESYSAFQSDDDCADMQHIEFFIGDFVADAF